LPTGRVGVEDTAKHVATFLVHRIEMRVGPIDAAGYRIDRSVAVEAAGGGGSARLEALPGSQPAPDSAAVDEVLLCRISRDEVMIEVGVVELHHVAAIGYRGFAGTQPLLESTLVGRCKQIVAIMASAVTA